MREFFLALLILPILSCGEDTAKPRGTFGPESSPRKVSAGNPKEISDLDSEEIDVEKSAKAEEPLNKGEGSAPRPAPSTAIDSNFIANFLSQIAGPAAAGRLSGSPQNKMVADLIAQEFTAAGLAPGAAGGSYFQPFTVNSSVTGSVQTQNIIGVLPGQVKSQEVIVVGAHMDHLGVRSGQTYFGADDNASGTAALIAVAKALTQSRVPLERTVVFIAFSGEELGLLGSLHYVRNPTVPLSQIKFMLNMDMVGYSRGSLDAIGFGKTLEADRIVKDLIAKSGLTPRYYASAGGGSDHMPFEQLSIPSAVLHTGVHENYHQPSDTLSGLDQANLGKIAGLAADFVALLARTPMISLRPLELEPLSYYALSASLHSPGCTPGFVDFETVQQSLADLKAERPL